MSVKIFLDDAKFYFLSKLLQGFSFLISIKIFTSYLSPEKYGEYSVLLVIITLFSLTTTTWINASMIRLYQIIENKEELTHTTFYLLSKTIAIGSFVFLFVLNFGISKFINLNSISIIISIIYYISLSIFNYIIINFSVRRQVLLYAKCIIIQIIVFVLLSSVMLVLKQDYILIFISNILSNLIAIIFTTSKKIINNLKVKSKKMLEVQIYKYGMPVLFIQLFGSLTMFSDQIFLKYYGFEFQVGVYAANYTLIDKSINIIASVFITSFQPILFEIWKKESHQNAYIFLFKVIILFLIITLVTCILLFFSYDLLVKHLLKSSYHIGDLIYYIMIGSVLLGVSNFLSEILNAHQKTKKISLIYGITFLVSFVANLYFVPKHGMKATAMVNVLAYSILFIGMFMGAIYYIKNEKST